MKRFHFVLSEKKDEPILIEDYVGFAYMYADYVFGHRIADMILTWFETAKKGDVFQCDDDYYFECICA